MESSNDVPHLGRGWLDGRLRRPVRLRSQRSENLAIGLAAGVRQTYGVGQSKGGKRRDEYRTGHQIEHVTMRSSKPFVTVKANLERLVPKLDEGIFQLVADGKIERLKQKLEEGPELAIFLCRDHGGLLKTIGRANKAVQYEIGNPLTASKMTRHQLAAGLYAPLRVILYEDETGGPIS
jgi:hypothetical protein